MNGIERHWKEVEASEREARWSRYKELQRDPLVMEYVNLSGEFAVRLYPGQIAVTTTAIPQAGLSGTLAGLFGGIGGMAAQAADFWGKEQRFR